MNERVDVNASWDPPTAIQNGGALNAEWNPPPTTSAPGPAPTGSQGGHFPAAATTGAMPAVPVTASPSPGAATITDRSTLPPAGAPRTAEHQPVAPSPPVPPQVVAAPGSGVAHYGNSTITHPEYASFGARLGARMLDMLFVLLVFIPVFIGVVWAIAAATGVDPLAAVIIGLWIDFGLWELAYYLVGASHGQTVGKRMIGIRVCRDGSGERLGFWKALGRQFASILSTLGLFIGWLAPLWTPKRQTWHDSMTNTVVIRDRAAAVAKPAVVWGLFWTLVSGAGFGSLAAWGIDALEDAGYEVSTEYGSGLDSGYGTLNSGDGYDDGTSGYDSDVGSGYSEDEISGAGSYSDDSYSDGPGYTDEGGGSGYDNNTDGYDSEEFSGGGASSGISTGSLESIAAVHSDDARRLVGSWVVQLASSPTDYDNQAGVEPMTESEVRDRLNGAERRYAGTSYTPLLIRSADYNFKYTDMWVVVLDRTYSNHEAALEFCALESYPRDHCLAKLLDNSSVWEGTSKMLPKPGR